MTGWPRSRQALSGSNPLNGSKSDRSFPASRPISRAGRPRPACAARMWSWSLAASTCPPLACARSPPRKSVTKPPASRTSRMPAAMSQGWRSSSQKPSKRPAATQARSSAAEPKRRMPATSGATASKIGSTARQSPWPRYGMPVAISASARSRRAETRRRRSWSQAPLPFLGPEALVGQRLIDERRVISPQPLPVGFGSCDRDRDREMRDAVEEVGGAVERIDDPARLGRIALDLAAFLEQQAPVGPRVAKLVDDGLLGLLSAMRRSRPAPCG